MTAFGSGSSTWRRIHDVIDRGLVCSVYQPIVELESGAVVGYEALARGPHGSVLESPGQLFSAAIEAGRLADLDWPAAAPRSNGALQACLPPSVSLFVNSEPAALGTDCLRNCATSSPAPRHGCGSCPS